VLRLDTLELHIDREHGFIRRSPATDTARCEGSQLTPQNTTGGI